jgi:hypothetical protein
MNARITAAAIIVAILVLAAIWAGAAGVWME